MRKNFYMERECVHRDAGAEGEFYNGSLYVQALQRLPGKDAIQIARQIEQFYWADAPNLLIWLCADCAQQLHLNDAPRMVTPIAHQQRRVSSL